MRKLLAVTGAGIAALALAGGLTACGGTTVVPVPGPTITQQPQPTHTKYVPVPAPPPAPAPAPAPPTSYAQDITNAGIVAPVAWINSTGATLCADWASGMSWTQTDNAVLVPGGIYPYHLATYDSITASDLCPAYGGGN